MSSPSVGIKKTIRGSLPRIPFEEIARTVLPAYELSLVICGDALARRMNIAYRLPALNLRQARKKGYAPNVLSFPLDKKSGEIFLNVAKAKREARQFGTTLRARLALLYVHGLFHLKGLGHGDAMEKEERKILRKFKLAA